MDGYGVYLTATTKSKCYASYYIIFTGGLPCFFYLHVLCVHILCCETCVFFCF